MNNKLSAKIVSIALIAIVFTMISKRSESAPPPPLCSPSLSLPGNISDCTDEYTNERSPCVQECYIAYCGSEPYIEDCEGACAGCCLEYDTDGDCNPDAIDNCGDIYNLTQLDKDSDMIGDVCDNCPEIPNGRGGGTCTRDSVGDPCRGDANCGMNGLCNEDQEDTDGDGIGDVCDSDITTSILVGSKWNVFAIILPVYGISFGEAIVSFFKRGSAVVKGNNPSVGRLPFSYLEKISFGDVIFLTIDEFGWGIAKMDTGIMMVMFGGYQGWLNSIIFGVPKTCAEEGEIISIESYTYLDHCCVELTAWYLDLRISIGDTCYNTGNASVLSTGRCINCGNGICENFENVCNCEQDCAGGLNSDYGTIDEFCSEYWTDAMARKCEELPEMRDLPICDLCE